MGRIGRLYAALYTASISAGGRFSTMAVFACLSVGWVLPGLSPSALHSMGSSPVARADETDPTHSNAPLVVFAVIGDTHISKFPFDDYRYLKARSIAADLLANCVKDINAYDPPVDFAVQVGDLTDFGEPGEFDLAKSVLDSLLCPLYPVVGNHDNIQSDNKEAWKAFAGRDSTSYSFDAGGFHFVVIDCTNQPYESGAVCCDSLLRDWLARDLIVNFEKPTFVFSHYNLWTRPWNAAFGLGRKPYGTYAGTRQLREVMECAGNVIAYVNGHVHANRVEVHNGIYYIDINATLVGRPSLRYFWVYPDRVEVSYEYLSDTRLVDYVSGLCSKCSYCFDPEEVCDYIDGGDHDKTFTIPVQIPTGARRTAMGLPARLALTVLAGEDRRIEAVIRSELCGKGDFVLHDGSGNVLDMAGFRKHEAEIRVDVSALFPRLADLQEGTYFLQVRLEEQSQVARVVLAVD